MGGMDRIKGEGNEQQSDRAEKHHQNRLYLDRFEVQKVRLLIKNASWLHSELCFLCRRGAHFQKNYENKWLESESWSQKTLDGKCDGYMWGLGGAKKRKC